MFLRAEAHQACGACLSLLQISAYNIKVDFVGDDGTLGVLCQHHKGAEPKDGQQAGEDGACSHDIAVEQT